MGYVDHYLIAINRKEEDALFFDTGYQVGLGDQFQVLAGENYFLPWGDPLEVDAFYLRFGRFGRKESDDLDDSEGDVIKEYFYDFEALNSDFTIDFSTEEITYHNKYNEIDWKVTIVDTGLNTLKGGRIKRLENYLDNEISMVTYGDGLADIDINKLVQFHKSHGKTLTFTSVHPSGRFGEFEEKNNSWRNLFSLLKNFSHSLLRISHLRSN